MDLAHDKSYPFSNFLPPLRHQHSFFTNISISMYENTPKWGAFAYSFGTVSATEYRYPFTRLFSEAIRQYARQTSVKFVSIHHLSWRGSEPFMAKIHHRYSRASAWKMVTRWWNTLTAFMLGGALKECHSILNWKLVKSVSRKSGDRLEYIFS